MWNFFLIYYMIFVLSLLKLLAPKISILIVLGAPTIIVSGLKLQNRHFDTAAIIKLYFFPNYPESVEIWHSIPLRWPLFCSLFQIWFSFTFPLLFSLPNLVFIYLWKLAKKLPSTIFANFLRCEFIQCGYFCMIWERTILNRVLIYGLGLGHHDNI